MLSGSSEHLRFFTKWIVFPQSRGHITARQIVELHGIPENVINEFVFDPSEGELFKVSLENEIVGTVHGHGLFDATTVSWEFRGNPSFEGFEIYRLEENGDYMVHSEYVSTDSHRTTIDGRIWYKGL